MGGGGGGGYGSTNGVGGGGGGAGFGHVTFSYVGGTQYTSTVAAGNLGQWINGQSSTFLNTSNQGVTSTGGAAGTVDSSNTSRANSGTCTNNGIGTLVSRTGGTGGAFNQQTGNNSSGSITVLGVTYNFGGGGAAGNGTSASASNQGGGAGANGVGGSGGSGSIAGQNATTPGSGGGGGAWQRFAGGANGGPGRVIVTFTYP